MFISRRFDFRCGQISVHLVRSTLFDERSWAGGTLRSLVLVSCLLLAHLSKRLDSPLFPTDAATSPSWRAVDSLLSWPLGRLILSCSNVKLGVPIWRCYWIKRQCVRLGWPMMLIWTRHRTEIYIWCCQSIRMSNVSCKISSGAN